MSNIENPDSLSKEEREALEVLKLKEGDQQLSPEEQDALDSLDDEMLRNKDSLDILETLKHKEASKKFEETKEED